jgi:hypothetical protein
MSGKKTTPIGKWATTKNREHVGAMALSVAGFFHEEGGINYVQFEMEGLPEVDPLLVVVQRKDRKTAHDLRKEAEAELAALRASEAAQAEELKRLRKAFKDVRENIAQQCDPWKEPALLAVLRIIVDQCDAALAPEAGSVRRKE